MAPYGGGDDDRDDYESRGPRGTRVYVGGLSDVVKKDDLQAEFEKFGKLNSVWVAFNPPGFAFVEFAERTDAEAACDSMNDYDLMGSKLRVEISRGRGRGRGGGRGGPRGRGDFRDSRGGGGFRGSRGGGFRGGRDSFGSRGGGRGGGRYGDDYEDRRGSSSFRGGRDSRDSYGSGGRSYGGGGGGYRGGKDSSRFRSRSPVGRGSIT
nr:PREDICTED: RNA-binding protein Rsf1-like isoform X2 [Bemisia tabaci]